MSCLDGLMRRHPWKTSKYIRFENKLAEEHEITDLGVWLDDHLTGTVWTYKGLAGQLERLAGESVSHETVRAWYSDWKTYEPYLKGTT